MCQLTGDATIMMETLFFVTAKFADSLTSLFTALMLNLSDFLVFFQSKFALKM